MPTFYVSLYRPVTGAWGYGASGEPFGDDSAVRGGWQVDGVISSHQAIAAVLAYTADQYLGSDITVTRLIPCERTNDEKLEDARRVLRADYWDDVRSVVDDVKEEIERGSLTTTDQVNEYLDERIDSTQRVIYTYQAMEAVIFSDNDGAYEEHFGSEGMVEDGQVQWSRLAFYAMQADVFELLGDIEELLADSEPECYLCGVAFTEDDETEPWESRGKQHRTHVECPEDEEDDDE